MEECAIWTFASPAEGEEDEESLLEEQRVEEELQEWQLEEKRIGLRYRSPNLIHLYTPPYRSWILLVSTFQDVDSPVVLTLDGLEGNSTLLLLLLLQLLPTLDGLEGDSTLLLHQENA